MARSTNLSSQFSPALHFVMPGGEGITTSRTLVARAVGISHRGFAMATEKKTQSRNSSCVADPWDIGDLKGGSDLRAAKELWLFIDGFQLMAELGLSGHVGNELLKGWSKGTYSADFFLLILKSFGC